MPLQALEPRRLYRQIADQIGVLISDGEYTPGARLPPRSAPAGRQRQTITETAVKSVVRSVSSSIGSAIGRQIVRGVLGSILKG